MKDVGIFAVVMIIPAVSVFVSHGKVAKGESVK